jgi:hypothetical protein
MREPDTIISRIIAIAIVFRYLAGLVLDAVCIQVASLGATAAGQAAVRFLLSNRET